MPRLTTRTGTPTGMRSGMCGLACRRMAGVQNCRFPFVSCAFPRELRKRGVSMSNAGSNRRTKDRFGPPSLPESRLPGLLLTAIWKGCLPPVQSGISRSFPMAWSRWADPEVKIPSIQTWMWALT